jgi:hypothetical protein
MSEMLDERLTYLHSALDMQTRLSGSAGSLIARESPSISKFDSKITA